MQIASLVFLSLFGDLLVIKVALGVILGLSLAPSFIETMRSGDKNHPRSETHWGWVIFLLLITAGFVSWAFILVD